VSVASSFRLVHQDHPHLDLRGRLHQDLQDAFLLGRRLEHHPERFAAQMEQALGHRP
jgi:hypothetical protein